ASGADWLILDEPSNHLDGRHRQQLYERLQQWRAWASGADWLILDEPSNHLDGRHRQQLYERLQQWR
ncbi:ABC transporter ATP-binding protein, partial [Stenotrophomonas maltophilia]